MLGKLVPFTGNVGGNFLFVRKSYTGHFTKCRIWLSGSHCANSQNHTSFKRGGSGFKNPVLGVKPFFKRGCFNFLKYFLSTGPIEINTGRPTRSLEVTNRGDRPVQVGSHCHFFEVNRFLDFDREAAYGMRLNIAAGTAVRFEPGDTREVELVAIGGRREVVGLNRLVEGALDDPAVRHEALERCRAFARTAK